MIVDRIIPRIGLAMIILSFSGITSAQETDWGLWTTIGAEIKLSKKWQLEAGGEYRWKEEISTTDQIRGSFDVKYKVWKYVRLGAGYELIADKKKKKDIYVYRHRFKLDALANYKVQRFTLSWRPRLQTTLYDDQDLDKDDTDSYKWVFRNRFGVNYNIPKIPLKPYVQYELFHHIFSDLEPSYYKNRFTVGLEYTIAKKHEINLAYLYDNEILDSKKYYFNVISAGYKFSF